MQHRILLTVAFCVCIAHFSYAYPSCDALGETTDFSISLEEQYAYFMNDRMSLLVLYNFPRFSPTRILLEEAQNIRGIVNDMPGADKRIFCWKSFDDALGNVEYSLDMPTMHALCLSRMCPCNTTQRYIELQMSLPRFWEEEWGMGIKQPSYRKDDPTRITAMDMLLVAGSVEQLEMVLREYPSLVWPYVQAAMQFKARHPLRSICTSSVSRSEANAKIKILWDYVESMKGCDDDKEDMTGCDDDKEEDDDDYYLYYHWCHSWDD